MYSYFVFLSMNDGSFIQLHVSSGLRPQDVPIWMKEFFKAVDARLKELRRPEKTKDAFRFRILLDPAHQDPDTVTPDQAVEMNLKGAWRLSREYSGRTNNSPI